MENKRSLTILFYSAIGLTAGLCFFWLLYTILRIDSSISGLVFAEKGNSAYLWVYSILTIGTIILFAVDIVLFIRFSRRFGSLKMGTKNTTALGSIFAVLASACPVCGSTLLSLLGATSGLALLPFQGLEIKVISLILMALPIVLIKRQEKKACATYCPKPRDDSFSASDHGMLIVIVAVLVFVGTVIFSDIRHEPIFTKNFDINDPTLTQGALCKF